MIFSSVFLRPNRSTEENSEHARDKSKESANEEALIAGHPSTALSETEKNSENYVDKYLGNNNNGSSTG